MEFKEIREDDDVSLYIFLNRKRERGEKGGGVG